MPVKHKAVRTKPELTLEDLFGKKKLFEPKSIAGLASMHDGLHYTVLENGKRIVRYRYQDGSRAGTIFNIARCGNKDLKKIESYAFSQDETHILLVADVKKIYRHSYWATYYVWNIKKGKLSRISRQPEQQLAQLSADGSRIAFVSHNNLFTVDLATGKERQITRDGQRNRIINGAGDWVYEEEFGVTCGFGWSPDARYLAYYRFDESKVRQFTISNYKGQYPELFQYKYPRAGEANSVVTVHVHDLATRRTRAVDIGKDKRQYIPRMKWTPDGQLVVTRVNRLQNRGEYLLADPKTGRTRSLLVEKNKRYVEMEHLTFLDDGRGFLQVSERDGWRHIYHHDMNGKLIRQVTQGRWDVTAFLGCDQENGLVYYLAADPTPMTRTLFAARLDGSQTRRLSTQTGWNSASFSKSFRYYINTFTTAARPAVTTLHDASGKLIRTLQNNAPLARKLARYNLSAKEFFSFRTEQGVTLNGWMIKPPAFNPRKKYPLFMTVYGGPNSQTVTDTWGVGWDHLLAQKGYIVASVDNRGTGARGENFRKCTYKQLGKLEVIDQVQAAKYLGAQPYVDKARIGIFGWSYGGFMATGCILRGADTFKLAVAVASVTNFRFYDSVYTERFMRTPQENPRGYDLWAPLSHADKLKGKLLLVHGAADDNVHYQNTMELVSKLVEANKPFEMHIVPNKDHGINGHPTRIHLYTRMTNFILENL